MDKFKLRVNPIRELMLIIGFILMFPSLLQYSYVNYGVLSVAMIFGGVLELLHLFKHRKFYKMVHISSTEINFSMVLTTTAVLLLVLKSFLSLQPYYIDDIIFISEAYLIGLFITHSYFATPQNRGKRIIVSITLIFIVLSFQSYYPYFEHHPRVTIYINMIFELFKFSLIAGSIYAYNLIEPKLEKYQLTRDDYIVGGIHIGFFLLLMTYSPNFHYNSNIEIVSSILINIFSLVIIYTLIINEFMKRWINIYSQLPFDNLIFQLSLGALSITFITSLLKFHFIASFTIISSIILIVIYIQKRGVKCLNIKKLYSQK